MNEVEPLGALVRRLRTERGWSQAELAERVGVAQSTVSRVEGSASTGAEKADLVAALADVLGFSSQPYIDVGNGAALVPTGVETFWARCTNPMCSANYPHWKDGQAWIRWDSDQQYDISDMDDVNFCGRCGRALAKMCPNKKCGRVRVARHDQFCTRCGTAYYAGPTAEEWETLRRRLAPTGGADEDIPF